MISTRKKDYLMLQIENMKKVFAKLLNKTDWENKNELIQTVNEGLKCIDLTIDDIRQQDMEMLIRDNQDTLLLAQIDFLLDIYLQNQADEEIQKKRNILLKYLHETGKTCSFYEFQMPDNNT